MNLTEYQKFTTTVSLYKDTDSLFLGLCEEAGEVAGKRKKFNRRDYYRADLLDEGEYKYKQDLVKELGDAMWHISEICNAHGLTIQEVIEANVEKLTSRKERGVIQGSGDSR